MNTRAKRWTTSLLLLWMINQVHSQTIHDGYLDVGVQVDSSCAVTHFFLDIGKKENLQVRWYPGPLDKAAAELEQRVFDVSAHGISNINAAAPTLALASEPYLSVKRGFTVLQEGEFASLKSLPAGAKVGVMDNSTALQDIKLNYPSGYFDLTIIPMLEGSPRAMLRAGKIDAIAEGYTGFWFNPDDAKDLVMIDVHPLYENDPDAEGLVFWVQQEDTALLNMINEHLEDVNTNIYFYYQTNKACDTHYAFPPRG
ncbi:Uncharacterised protein [BD1-7 clade bacterium]|uniref:Solute-binding protein family 3/N-terminal domain-containing protein n=1 Tax=BD1-7 clade bacterium TaxID=2029982 RepID=A0A5S9P7R7_9GAMM|nr:Uncharacterised protein [BD1-7 clade bacterium]CAA0099578.1 Uncharacterised protein [BD1-7 clade bacterium]